MKTVLLAICLILFPVTAFSQPSIQFDSEKHNFGEVSKGIIEHTFEFKNIGNEDLVIDDVIPS